MVLVLGAADVTAERPVAFAVLFALLIQRRVGRVQSLVLRFRSAGEHGTDGGTIELDRAMHGRVLAQAFTCVRCSATQLGRLYFFRGN